MHVYVNKINEILVQHTHFNEIMHPHNKSYRHAVYACRKSPLTLPGHRSFGIKTNIVLVDEVTIM